MYSAWYYNGWAQTCCTAQAAALTLAGTFSGVLDIGPRHPSYWQKTVKKSLQVVITFKEKLSKNLKLPKWDVWNELSGYFRLNIEYCTELNEVELSLWDLSYNIGLRELKYANYDGLEMKLKVTKNVFWDDYILFTVWWWWWWAVRLSWVLRLLWCTVWGLERNPKCPEELIAWRKSPMEIAWVLKWVS